MGGGPISQRAIGWELPHGRPAVYRRIRDSRRIAVDAVLHDFQKISAIGDAAAGGLISDTVRRIYGAIHTPWRGWEFGQARPILLCAYTKVTSAAELAGARDFWAALQETRPYRHFVRRLDARR